MIDYEYSIKNTGIYDITINNVYLIDYEMASFILNRNVCILYNCKRSDYTNFFKNFYLGNNHWKTIDTFFILFTLIYRLYPRLKYTLKKNVIAYIEDKLINPIHNKDETVKVPFNKTKYEHELLCVSSIIPNRFKQYIAENIFLINSITNVQKNSLKYLSNPFFHQFYKENMIVYNFFNKNFRYDFYMQLYINGKITKCDKLPEKPNIILNIENMKNIIKFHKLRVDAEKLFQIYTNLNKPNEQTHNSEKKLLKIYKKKKEDESNYTRAAKRGTSKIIDQITANFQPNKLIETFNKILLDLNLRRNSRHVNSSHIETNSQHLKESNGISLSRPVNSNHIETNLQHLKATPGVF